MPQKGDSILTNENVEDDIAETVGEHINVVQGKANTDMLSTNSDLYNNNSSGEISHLANSGSTSLSLNLAQIEYVPENTIENSSVRTIAEMTEPGLQGNEINVQGINTILDAKDSGVMYFSHDGTLVFDHPGLSSDNSENMPIILDPNTGTITSDATLSSNYLVVVENIDGSQVLSTTMQGNLVLSPGNDISVSSISPQSHISFSTGGNHDRGKLRHVSDFPQTSSIAMVLDNATSASHLNSKGLVVEPNSFIAYADHTYLATDQLTFHTVQPVNDTTESTALLYEQGDDSFIDISGLNVVVAEKPSNTSLNHAQTFQAAIFSSQATEPVSNEKEHLPLIACTRQSVLHLGQEKLGVSVSPSDNQTVLKSNTWSQTSDQSELDQVKKDRLKQELHVLEQCHLEHHLKQVQKKQSEKIHFQDEIEESEIRKTIDEHVDLSLDREILQTPEADVDDDTPIFTSITATLNSAILAHIPGCQQFLLDKAQNYASCFDIDFTSDKDCTFNGTLKSLITLHNLVKNLLKLKSKTLLEFKSDQSEVVSLDKSVMCDLLKPYISLRGRQPRCSLKAAEMGFVSDVDMYLQTDAAEEPVDVDYDKNVSTGKSIIYQKKRKRGRPSRGMKNKARKIKMKSSLDDIASVLDLNANDSKNNSQVSQNDEVVMDVNDEGQTEVDQESHADTAIRQISVASDGAYMLDPLQQPTKQQRNYEEQVSFKFFCHQCSFKTKRHSHFISHMRCHKDGTEKKYTCKQCDFVTISIPMLKRHELRHSKSLFKCSICAAYTTDRQELLRRHFRMKHSVEKKESLEGKLSCDRCRFSCRTSEELERHKTVHDRLNQVSDEDNLTCPDCKKPFGSRMHLQRHVRDVHGPEVRPHLCDTCGKAFKRTDSLQQHKLVHMSRTARSFPFKCCICDKGFRSAAHLKEHMSMHSTERPFLCQYCGAAFKTQPVQKKHIMTLHIRPRAHVCSVCCRLFNTKNALQRHENTHAKSDSVTEAAVLVIERENAMADKEAADENDSTQPSTVDQSECLAVSESAPLIVEGTISDCLVQDMIATSTSDEPAEQPGQTLQQAYIQGTQDGTLYYFTGELPTL
ncbi:unnamed protein product [Candidula unifasciata]|uniref:C2H2-type domain-containing protein n=1 Tax=Candidula unifasciata TaxID=100452 RepID=A0A8S3ZW82_9EUPU|nr:unnamed protein product [Candidula unifasciata]